MKILFRSLLPAIGMLFVIIASTDAQIVNQRSLIDNRSRTINSQASRNTISIQAILHKQYEQRQKKMNRLAAKTSSASGERLKAFCGYNFLDTAFLPYGKSDSGYYFYSGSRSSVFNYQMMDYAAPSLTTYTSPVDDNYPMSLTWGPGNSAIPQIELFPDSVYSWNSFFPPSIFGFAAISGYLYDGNNIIQTDNRYYPTIPGAITRSKNYYDGLGNLSVSIDFTFDTITHTWDTTNAGLFFYNSFNQLIMDSTSVNYGSGIWGEENKHVYAWDGSGNMIFTEYYTDSFGYWQPQTQRHLYYNADSTLHTDSVSQYNVGQWTPYTKDSFGYTPGISYFTYDQTEMFVSDTVYTKCIYSKNVSLSGLPDTVYYGFYGGGYFAPTQKLMGKKIFFTYDSLRNPLVSKSFNYNITDSLTGTGFYDSSPERTFYYYYETYDFTDVPVITASTERITIYPNPATDEITISRPDAVKGAVTFIKISNAMGQAISVESLPWMNETEKIPLSGLVPGLYLLTLQDGSGKVLATQKIMKL